MEELSKIIIGCKQHQSQYQRLLYDRYRGFACKVVFRYIYHYEKAMDVVTDGFVKAFRNFSDFQVPDDKQTEKILMGWLKRIMINTSIDVLRKGKMLPEIGGIPDHVWDISRKTDEADQQLLYKDLVIIMKELPPNYRVVFNLYVIEGYSHSQIAELMHISVSTSRSTLSRARIMLQNQIKMMEEKTAWRT